ncbi:hypothetical protein PY68_07545 [Lacticaseibacillus rhamnosus]|nr:hypothetical protein PY68_07545 [Lacticaseibacillus rhamnosus]
MSVFEALSLVNQVVDNFLTLIVLVTVLTAENKRQKMPSLKFDSLGMAICNLRAAVNGVVVSERLAVGNR